MITFPPLVQSRAVGCCAGTVVAVIVVALFAFTFDSALELSESLTAVGFAGADGDDAVSYL